MKISSLATPACLIDRPRFMANVARMQQTSLDSGLVWRPHVKTLKSLDAARYYAPITEPIAVSTIAEARAFANAGYWDILYAVGLSPDKYQFIDSIQSDKTALTVVIDSLASAQSLAQNNEISQMLNVMIELDADGCRAGVDPSATELITIASTLVAAPRLRFRGLMVYAGGAYGCTSMEDIRRLASIEADKANIAKQALEQAGIACDVVSLGSTPTAMSRTSGATASEVRTGVCVTMDMTMADLGVCAVDDIAISVLTSVIGYRHDKNWLIVDAGWMAMSSDQGAHGLSKGYGLVADIQGNVIPGLMLSSMNQEHGIVTCADNAVLPDALRAPGTKLRIIPNHACATATNFPCYHLVDGGEYTGEKWQRLPRGWT